MKKTDSPTAIRRDDYKSPDFAVDSVFLCFVLDEQATMVSNTMALRNLKAADKLVLDGVDLELVELTLDGVALSRDRYQLDEKQLTIVQPPEAFELRVVSRIFPDKNTALEGLYRSSGMYCTQCEAEGFRKITWYPDRPDVLSVFHVRIEADKSDYPVMLSNGNETASGNIDSRRHFIEWKDPHPKPSYLFALVAGNLESVNDNFLTRSGRDVKLSIFVESHNIGKCQHAMNSLKQAMAWDESVYGLEYDLDIYMIVAVDDFNMGAMENKGLNIFNSRYVLADQETATDADFLGVEAVIAHEYFHNWTGNRITCRDWFQLSLKEGLTVFRDQEFSADMNSAPVKRIADVRLLRSRQFPEDASPMAHPIRPDEYIEINNFYSATVYEKGAEVIRMIYTLIGRENYFSGMALYISRFDGQAVTCEDFVKAMEDASGIDLSRFRFWYSQAGTPVVEVSDHYDSQNQSYTLTLSQDCPPTPGQTSKEPFHIPVRFGLINAQDRQELSLDSVLVSEGSAHLNGSLIHLDQPTLTVKFDQVQERPIPSLLREFSAPVSLRYNYQDSDLAVLLACDSDPFNRWEAGQRLYSRVIQLLSDDAGLSPEDSGFDEFRMAFESLLADPSVDSAFLAQALQLPNIETVAGNAEVIAVDDIHRALETLQIHLARRFEHQFRAIVEREYNATFSLDSVAIGSRSLRNTALGYLSFLEPDKWLVAVMDHYHNATNMSDRIAALRILSDTRLTERDEVLQDFYHRWSDDRLVIDKWFTVQALSKTEDVVSNVELLTRHNAFELSNPNRVRSLIGAFAMSNMAGFHHRSGSGYRLLADYVLKLDQTNPQVAARLVSQLAQWRRFDAERQQMMKAELGRISQREGLSANVFEIVTSAG